MISQPAISRAWEAAIDFLLPRLCCSCGDRIHEAKWLICEKCLDDIPELILPICTICGCPDAKAKNELKCTNCPPGKIWFSRARGIYSYEDVPRLLVEKLKYKGRLEYAGIMALSMARHIAAAERTTPDFIIPVPLHSTRQRERGFNQSLILAEKLGSLTHISVEQKILSRDKPTPTQTRLKRRERKYNVAGAFSCRKPELVEGRSILIIDDVYTTGSTLNECAKTLIEAGAESIECLAYTRATLTRT